MFDAISGFVPARGLRTRDGIAGALVTAVFLELISLASSYVYDKATKLSVIYGSLTVGLVFLYSTYLYASALLFETLGEDEAKLLPDLDVGEAILSGQFINFPVLVRVKEPASKGEREERDAFQQLEEVQRAAKP